MAKFPAFKKSGLSAALLAVAAVLAAAQILRTEYRVAIIFSYADRGWALLYGLKDSMIAFSMPLLSVLMTFIDYEPRRLELAVNAALILLFFSAYTLGRLKGGGLGGALYAFVAALAGFSRLTLPDPEQVFYALLVVMYLNLEADRKIRPGPARSFLAGLALGGTLLVRSPLFLFPVVLGVLDFPRAHRDWKAVFRETAFFLLGAYILLAPWVRLNYFVSGRFIPFENERATCNIITGVKGSIYTIEGDSRILAGLSREDDVFKWAVGQALSEPGVYLSAVAKRLWHVFKMFPAAFLLAALALLYLKAHSDPVLAALCAYFVLIHCLFSIEERYFYPLWYLLGFVAADGAAAALSRGREVAPSGAKAAYALFAPVLGFILAVEYAVLAYPFRAAGDYLSGVEAALKKTPEHPWLLMTRAETLIRSKRTEEGLAALRAAVKKAGGKKYSDAAEILRIVDSPLPSETRSEFGLDHNALLFTALKELETGMIREAGLSLTDAYYCFVPRFTRLNREAGQSLRDAYLQWSYTSNTLRAIPYERDRAILKELRVKDAAFQDRYIFGALLYWPPERRTLILDALEKHLPLTDRLGFLKFISMPLKSEKDLAAFSALAGNSGVMAQAGAGDYGMASRQLMRALLPVKRPPGLGGPLETALALLENRDAGAGLIERSSECASPDKAEMTDLVALYAGRDAAAAERLYDRCPSNALYFVLALRSMDAGGAARAREQFRDRTEFLLDAAAVYASRGAKAEAAALAAAALKSARLDSALLRRSALTLQDAGRYREALAAIDRAAGADPGNQRLYNDRGVIRMFLGDRRAAELDFLAALAIEPGFWEAQLNLARLRSAAGRRAEAEAVYRRLAGRSDLPAAVKSFISAELAVLEADSKTSLR